MKLKQIKTDVLLQMYANACTTGCCAGGHMKGHMNLMRMKEYGEELNSRGITVALNTEDRFHKLFKPSVEIPEGVFNGEGCW